MNINITEHDACGIGAVVDIYGRKSRQTVTDALKIVEKLDHRAGKDASGETGDGVGIMIQIPHELFSAEIPDLGCERGYGVGMFFFPTDKLQREWSKKLFEVVASGHGVKLIGWRCVPVRPDVLGKRARDCMPSIWQAFLKRPENIAKGFEFDRLLYLVRREFEQSAQDTYVVSLSSRTIVYKGMFLVSQLRQFYDDLRNDMCLSSIALVHSRFSTNTTPSWERAHPNRFIMHNGEINTIRGNVSRMLAREETMHSEFLDANSDKVLPVISNSGSDSAMLDNTLEFMYMNGIDLPLAVMMTIPEPWKNDEYMDTAKRNFYHYYATMMEPWDGPAALLFSDGDLVGASLDRNGLRPSRYYTTSDGRLILSSEVGVLDIPDELITGKFRLQPGKMLLVDTQKGKLYSDGELKELYASRKPYGEWLGSELTTLSSLDPPQNKRVRPDNETLCRLYAAFGYSYEDLHSMILPMAQNGVEPTASMGIDIPLAVLSEKHQSLFSYFKQLFAQVTNPPIDSLREKIVTDTTVYAGSDGNLLDENSSNCRVLQIDDPILTEEDIEKIKQLNIAGLKARVIPILYYRHASLEKALDRLFLECDKAYREGNNILILSDRGVDENHMAIPSLLAVSAVEQYLVRTRKRTLVSIIAETGEVRDVHQAALLLSYGARAVNPYLAHECIASLIDEKLLHKDYDTAVRDYNKALLSGIVKIAAKMGISAIQSYQSAQIFEAVGICGDVIDKYFTGTVSRVGGIGLDTIAEGVEYRHDHAFDPLGLSTDNSLSNNGIYRMRSGSGKEDHMYDPKVIVLLQQATQTGDYERFKEYSALVDDSRRPHTLRGLLKFNFDESKAVALSEVESASEIVKRFKTGAMSYGSISQEAHECMAIAMNTLGGKSNSGEGGERPERLHSNRNSAIKQIASGRFGVTSEYLVSAKEIQIKMAQGAKPGEGGHLPGAKVYPWIARTRYSTPGVSLISPPPHHDIYSIEDLAQLIYDLKNANPKAGISVKLVSEAGVGTIASGVAKAGAQVILISGFDGGTGAAPQTSIHGAGLPWELGVSEAHRALIDSGLRSLVAIETDGKLMTGRDVAIAALLGAEQFGFATAPLVTMGCMMMRVCNKDTCPFGVATQNEELRCRFKGKPEYVMNFMMFVAEELREIMAKLGFRTVDEMIGRTDKLSVRENPVTKRAGSVDMSAVIGTRCAHAEKYHFDSNDAYDFHLENTKDSRILLKELDIEKLTRTSVTAEVCCTDRAFGTMFGSAVTEKYGTSLCDDTFRIDCVGGAGQSFGAFLPKGVTMTLKGDANDSFGKGLSGGKIAVYPQKENSDGNVIVGNVALYGATSGYAFIRGEAGERFCVRNSGASAVVEGCGDHGCEYMTGGVAVVIGKTGKNFAAGMSGGVAYVYDPDDSFIRRLNSELVTVTEVCEASDIEKIKELLTKHIEMTGSVKAEKVLEKGIAGNFKRIMPNDYKRVRDAIAKALAEGKTEDEAEIYAFRATR